MLLRTVTRPLRLVSTTADRAGQLLDSTAEVVDRIDDLHQRTREGSHASVMSFRSVYSVLSWFSAGSAVSVGSAGSFASVASVGSLGSFLSAGSILSIGSAGSILSIGSSGSVGAIGGSGQMGPRAARVLHTGATVLAVAALAAAARGAPRG